MAKKSKKIKKTKSFTKKNRPTAGRKKTKHFGVMKNRGLKKSGKKGSRASKQIISEDAILKLIEKGRHRGFITESEIINTLPNIEKDISGLERLYERLEAAKKENPDLILLDIRMPVMDGMTALKKIRQDAWGAHVPVIILTNLSANNEQLVEDVVFTPEENGNILEKDRYIEEIKKEGIYCEIIESEVPISTAKKRIT